jgi:DNA-binding transcriptional LysR family regulator
LHVRRWVQEFVDGNPGVEIELDANDRRVDLVDGEFDVALRFGSEMPKDQIARKLAVSPRVLVAAPELLTRSGDPTHPTDLSELPFVGWATDFEASKIRLSGPAGDASIKMSPRLHLSCGILVREAVADGAGFGQLPLWIVSRFLEDGRLVRLLPHWCCPHQDLYAVYPSRKFLPQRVKLFLDFLSKRIEQAHGFEAHAWQGRANSPDA